MSDSKLQSTEAVDFYRNYYAQQCDLLGQLFRLTLDRRGESAKLLIGTSNYTARAIDLLSSAYLTNECYILGRAYFERLTNFCYLIVCDEEEFQGYFDYSIQKAHRKLDREITIADVTISLRQTSIPNPTDYPELKQAIARFTSVKGKEVTRWTSKRLEERIEIMKGRSDIDVRIFMMLLLTVYEDSSESLHGTLYGSLFHTAVFDTDGMQLTPDQVQGRIYSRLAVLLWFMAEMGLQVMELIGSRCDILDILGKARENSLRSHEKMNDLLKRDL